MARRYPISRRTLLRGLGTALALPWLEVMSPARSRAATGTEGKPPLRLGVLFKGNGVHPPSWDIAGAGESDACHETGHGREHDEAADGDQGSAPRRNPFDACIFL